MLGMFEHTSMKSKIPIIENGSLFFFFFFFKKEPKTFRTLSLFNENE